MKAPESAYRLFRDGPCELPTVSISLTSCQRWHRPATAASASLRLLLLLLHSLLRFALALEGIPFQTFRLSDFLPPRQGSESLRPRHRREPVRLLFWLLARLCAFLWRCACWIRRRFGSSMLFSVRHILVFVRWVRVHFVLFLFNAFLFGILSPSSSRSPGAFFFPSSSRSLCAPTPSVAFSRASCALLSSSCSSQSLSSFRSSRRLPSALSLDCSSASLRACP